MSKWRVALMMMLIGVIGAAGAGVDAQAQTNSSDRTAPLPGNPAALGALITIGTGTGSWNYPLHTYYHDSRTQVIYLASEIGRPGRISSLALDVTTLPGQTLNACTIRMKHTTKADYSGGAQWESSGWTTVYQASRSISATGWVTIAFSTPFNYDGSNNLLVDFSYNNSSFTSDGQARYTPAAAYRSIYYASDSMAGDPLTWSGSSPSPTSSSNVPNIQLNLDNMDNFGVTPGASFESAGGAGGPFTPPATTYTLTNNGSGALNWSATGASSWLSLTPASGALAGGGAVVVRAALTSAANALAVGNYATTLTFTNLATGFGEKRPVRLAVVPPPAAPSNPRPLHGALNVPLDAELSWNNPTAAAATKKAAVCGAVSDATWLNDVQSRLISTGQFASVSIINASLVTPSLAELRAFDAVLVFSDANYLDSTTLGNVLADYVDAGGAVVCAQFEISGSATTRRLQGRWESGGYYVIPRAATVTGSATLGTVYDASHPIMKGVRSFNGGSSSYRPNATGLTAGATRIADWSDGKPLAATKMVGVHRRADLGFYPMSSSLRSDFWQITTDGALLLANALSWVCGGDSNETWDVYFGQVNPPTARVASGLATPACDPGPLTTATAYYWQVVAHGVGGTTAGPVWAFTSRTAPGEIAVSDSIAPTTDLKIPFGAVQLDTTQTATITIANTDATRNLELSDIALGASYSEDFNDGTAQDWIETTDACWNVLSGEYQAQASSAVRMTSMYGGRTWDDLAVEVSCRKSGTAYNPVGVVLRASGNFDGVTAGAGSAYIFQLATSGEYSVWECTNGAWNALQGWTISSAIGSGVNVLRASASGATLRFYINGALVWTGSDSSLASGRIGLTCYTSVSTHNLDNVTVSPAVTGAAEPDAAQKAFNLLPRPGAPDLAPAPAPGVPAPAPARPLATVQAAQPFTLAGLPALPLVLTPGQSASFSVRFAPQTTQTLAEFVRLRSNDRDEPELQVALSGAGMRAVAIEHSPLGDTRAAGPYPVSAQITTLFGLGQASLHWSVNAGASWSSATLASQGGGRYGASLPAQPIGARLRYYLQARDTRGTTLTHPPGAPAASHGFLVMGVPRLTAAPSGLSFTQEPDARASQTLLLRNTGTWPADWRLAERRGAGALSLTAAAARPAQAAERRDQAVDWTAAHDPDTLLVGFKPTAAAAASVPARAAIHAAVGAARVSAFTLAPVDVVRRAPGADLQALAAAYAARPEVAYAEPNYRLHLLAGPPNDPQYGQLWGLNNTGQTGGKADCDIDAPEAWLIQSGSRNVIVGDIDTGIDYTHPDLAANLWVNPGEQGGRAGVDDDANGIVDDIYGAKWIGGAGAPSSGNPLDGHGHGTHTAGTIGAAGDNGVGVTGVCWRVRLMALKFLDDSGAGASADAIAALQYARAKGAHLTSNSWGGGAYSQALHDAIAAAGAAGQLFVAAAGNDGVSNETTPHYPSSYDCANIVAVAGSDANDARSYFSNWGVSSVDLAAPGSSILSTWKGGGYITNSGTSMATPHVAGVVALLLAQAPGATPAEIKGWLLGGVDKLPAWSSLVASGGRLNAAKALAQAGVSWLEETPAGGTLAAGASQAVVVTADSRGLADRTTTAADLLLLGDPATTLTVPVTLTVQVNPPNVPPTVLSLVRADGNPSSASTVAYRATFSEAVTGVGADDFALTADSLTDATVGGISGNHSVYTITVNTGNGQGTLQLKLIDNETIIDGEGLKLGGTGIGNGNFNGEAYTIDRVAPTVVLTSSAAEPTDVVPIPFTATFSETVSGLTTEGVTVTGGTIGGFSGSGSVYSWTVTPAGVGAITCQVKAGAARDAIGNGSVVSDTITRMYVSRVALVIRSARGSPSPAIGSHLYAIGKQVTAAVPAATFTDAQGTTRWVCTGWTAQGAAPASGAMPTVTFPIDRPTTLTWQWKTQFKLTATVSPSTFGRVTLQDGVTTATNTWHDAGKVLTLRAKANAKYRFAFWWSDLRGPATPVTLLMDKPHGVLAQFQTAGNGVDDWQLYRE